MAVRDDFTAGEVLAAADLNDTFASKPPFAYGTATPSTTVEGFIWYDENDTPPAPKFWDGSAFETFGGGKVLQVVAASTNTGVTTSSATFVDTTLTATITPSSASSKVLVLVAQAGCGKDTNDTTLGLRLLRDATQIAFFEGSGGWTAMGDRNFIGTCAVNWLDSPATTSAVTYKTQQNSFNGGANSFTQYNVGAGSPSSTIVLLEIK